MAAAVPSASPVDVTRMQVGVVADVAAAGRLERVERAASRALVGRLKRKLRDADDRQASRRQRFAIGDARGAHRDVAPGLEPGFGGDRSSITTSFGSVASPPAENRPGRAQP